MARKRQNNLFELDINFFKKYWGILLLLVIVIFGFYLRVYHIDYPVVGYHNWKETHYLTEARNFANDGFFKHGFFVPEYDFPKIYRDPSGVHADSFPMISFIVAILFKIFGQSLLVARFPGLLMNLLGVLGIYFLTKELTKGNKLLALLSAFLYANLPLLTFFSHNVQLENPGIFFMVFSLYFFMKWLNKQQSRDLIITAVFMTLLGLTRYNFLIIIVPMLLMVIHKRIINKKFFTKNMKTLIICFLVVSPLIFYFFYSSVVLPAQLGQEASVISPEKYFYPEVLFQKDFWRSTRLYVNDNYTFFGLILAFIGTLFALMKFKSSDFTRFLSYYFLALLISFPVVAYKIKGHSYHHYMFAIYVVLAMSYAIMVLGSTIANTVRGFLKGKYANYARTGLLLVLILVVCYFLFTSSLEARNRQFDTQFPGLDIAGEYIKQYKQSADERIIHSSHQAFGVLWHADLKGSRGIPSSIEDFKKLETERNSVWLFIYQWDFARVFNSELKEYIENNYELKQIAFESSDSNNVPVYFLLRLGGSMDFDNLGNYTYNKEVKIQTYEYTKGNRVLNYINV